MAQQNYDPCDLKQALKSQAQILGILVLALIIITVITAVSAAIIIGVGLLFQAYPALGDTTQNIIGVTLLGVAIAIPTGLILSLVFEPLIDWAACQLKRSH